MVGAVELRIVFHFAKDKNGKLVATFDSPDQGAKGIGTDSVTRDGDSVKVESKKLLATFDGTLNADGSRIAGQWKQAGQIIPIELTRFDKEPEDRRPQDPKKPYPYQEEEVSYTNQNAGVKLAATLTLPASPRPAPAVVLITGSGAQDRDESLLGHKPFLVLADYLTRQGIAVLRADDRGIGGSTGNTIMATTEDLAGDVAAAVAYLKTRSEIDPRRIGLIGHSEGGIIAPIVASRGDDVAFIVLLAGTGVNGEQIIERQRVLIAKADGIDQKTLDESQAVQARIYEIAKTEPDNATAVKLLHEAIAGSAVVAASTRPRNAKRRKRRSKPRPGSCSRLGFVSFWSTIRKPPCARCTARCWPSTAKKIFRSIPSRTCRRSPRRSRRRATRTSPSRSCRG